MHLYCTRRRKKAIGCTNAKQCSFPTVRFACISFRNISPSCLRLRLLLFLFWHSRCQPNDVTLSSMMELVEATLHQSCLSWGSLIHSTCLSCLLIIWYNVLLAPPLTPHYLLEGCGWAEAFNSTDVAIGKDRACCLNLGGANHEGKTKTELGCQAIRSSGRMPPSAHHNITAILSFQVFFFKYKCNQHIIVLCRKVDVCTR